MTGIRYSTAIIRVDWPCKNKGKFIVRGSVPATCDKVYDTEAECLAAILADPWIQATPGQRIQRADCSYVAR